MDVIKDDLKTVAIFGYLLVMFCLFMGGFLATTKPETEKQGWYALLTCFIMFLVPSCLILGQRWFG